MVRPMGRCAPRKVGGLAPSQVWCLRLKYKFRSSNRVINKTHSETIIYTLYFGTMKVFTNCTEKFVNLK